MALCMSYRYCPWVLAVMVVAVCRMSISTLLCTLLLRCIEVMISSTVMLLDAPLDVLVYCDCMYATIYWDVLVYVDR